MQPYEGDMTQEELNKLSIRKTELEMLQEFEFSEEREKELNELKEKLKDFDLDT